MLCLICIHRLTFSDLNITDVKGNWGIWTGGNITNKAKDYLKLSLTKKINQAELLDFFQNYILFFCSLFLHPIQQAIYNLSLCTIICFKVMFQKCGYDMLEVSAHFSSEILQTIHPIFWNYMSLGCGIWETIRGKIKRKLGN